MEQRAVGGGLSYDSFHGGAGGPQRPGQGDQLGDRPPVHIDAQPLARLDPAQELSGVIAEVTRRDVGHGYDCITQATLAVAR